MNSKHNNPTLFAARRRWLQRSGGTLAGALGLGTVGNLALLPGSARAADYKALVCVFLYGGNDGLNTIVPNDTARYNQYAGVRGGLAIPKASLVSLGGVEYGLHPSLAALAPVWADGKLAPVFNVGPLHQPLTKTQYLAPAHPCVGGNCMQDEGYVQLGATVDQIQQAGNFGKRGFRG